MINKSKPYSWIPTLYFAEGLPYVAVMTIATMMYKTMGLSNTDLALYTSWLYLPWVIKPLWSPIVDAMKTKRWWILTMQLLVGAGFAGVAFSIPTSLWLQASLAFFWLIAFSSATHDIAADGFYILALDSHDQAFYVGIRSTFYRIATIFGQGALVMLAGWLELYKSTAFSWAVTFALMAVMFVLFFVYHRMELPKPDTDNNRTAGNSSFAQLLRQQVVEFWLTLKCFFSKNQILVALLFMLLFRLPEAMLVKLVSPFMLDGVEQGGMALSTGEVGFIYGTIGVVGLTLGGILGGIAVSHGGLKKWLWYMVLSISLPDAVYIYLSYFQDTSLWVINSCVFVEQFGYGFGFTAYMLYLIYFARGERSTAVYAICTAFMALGMMLPGMFAGWLADTVGYRLFFIIVMICTAITAIVSALLRIDPEFGKKSAL